MVAMTKQEYIKENIDKLFYNWLNVGLVAGSLLILSLVGLDYLVTRENFSQFLFYRFLVGASFLVLFFINRRRVSHVLQVGVVSAASVIVSGMVAVMIMRFGGHESPYFAGFIVTVVFVLVFIPIDMKTSAVIASLIYFIYLVPILVYDNIVNTSFFLAANGFILAIVFISLLTRFLYQRRIVSELGLQFDLDSERGKLKDYSSHLEDVVQDRTKELRKSQAMLQTLYDNANDGIVIMDTNGLIINVNEKAIDMYGFSKEQMMGLNISLLELEKNKSLWEERMHRLVNGEALIFETEHYRKDGSTIVVEVSAKAIRIANEMFIQSILRDITEKKRLRSQLLHAQKMESIGTLAGGMAHDFNNILSAILGFTDIILNDENPSQSIVEKLRVVESSARKGTVLIAKLLSFSRRGNIDSVTFNLNSIIEEMTEMLGRLMPKTIVVKTDLSPEMPEVSGDVSQIEQMVMNLVINARDAMPDGGTLTIKTRIASLDDGSLPILAGIRSGSYVHLSISDTGTGIPSGYIDRIYEPFFTTKEVGKGTGLGLAMVYGIVKEHKGYITVESEQGKGTVFHLYLPVEEVPVPVHAESGGIGSHGSDDQILVVDDEVPVLELIRQTLMKEGYDIAAFTSPLDALDYFRTNHERIGLVVTDIVMPDMSGEELIRSVREVDRDMKIIAITGFSKTLKNEAVDGFLKKPFERPALLDLVKSLKKVAYNRRTGFKS